MLTARILVCALALTFASAALAGDPASQRNVVIVGDDGGKATITLDGSRLTVTTEDGDDVAVKEIDLEQVAGLIDGALDEALAGLDAAFDELAEADIDVRVAPDHRVMVRSGDKTTTIDLAEVMSSVSAALGDIEVVASEDETTGDAAEEAQLRAQIAALRAEIDSLRAELDEH